MDIKWCEPCGANPDQLTSHMHSSSDGGGLFKPPCSPDRAFLFLRWIPIIHLWAPFLCISALNLFIVKIFMLSANEWIGAEPWRQNLRFQIFMLIFYLCSLNIWSSVKRRLNWCYGSDDQTQKVWSASLTFVFRRAVLPHDKKFHGRLNFHIKLLHYYYFLAAFSEQNKKFRRWVTGISLEPSRWQRFSLPPSSWTSAQDLFARVCRAPAAA